MTENISFMSRIFVPSLTDVLGTGFLIITIHMMLSLPGVHETKRRSFGDIYYYVCRTLDSFRHRDSFVPRTSEVIYLYNVNVTYCVTDVVTWQCLYLLFLYVEIYTGVLSTPIKRCIDEINPLTQEFSVSCLIFLCYSTEYPEDFVL